MAIATPIMEMAMKMAMMAMPAVNPGEMLVSWSGNGVGSAVLLPFPVTLPASPPWLTLLGLGLDVLFSLRGIGGDGLDWIAVVSMSVVADSVLVVVVVVVVVEVVVVVVVVVVDAVVIFVVVVVVGAASQLFPL